MPKFKVLVVERWARYTEVEVEAKDDWDAMDAAKRMQEEDSDVDFQMATGAGLEFIEIEPMEWSKL